MHPAKQYRLNCINNGNKKSVYITEDRTQHFNRSAREADYLDYEDYQKREKIGGTGILNAIAYIMIAVLIITLIAGIYVAFQSFEFLSTFD